MLRVVLRREIWRPMRGLCSVSREGVKEVQERGGKANGKTRGGIAQIAPMDTTVAHAAELFGDALRLGGEPALVAKVFGTTDFVVRGWQRPVYGGKTAYEVHLVNPTLAKKTGALSELRIRTPKAPSLWTKTESLLVGNLREKADTAEHVKKLNFDPYAYELSAARYLFDHHYRPAENDAHHQYLLGLELAEQLFLAHVVRDWERSVSAMPAVGKVYSRLAASNPEFAKDPGSMESQQLAAKELFASRVSPVRFRKETPPGPAGALGLGKTPMPNTEHIIYKQKVFRRGVSELPPYLPAFVHNLWKNESNPIRAYIGIPFYQKETLVPEEDRTMEMGKPVSYGTILRFRAWPNGFGLQPTLVYVRRT